MAVATADRPRAGGLTFLDGDVSEVALDDEEAVTFLALVGGLERVTVSACPGCRSRILAAVALVDLLDAAPPHPRASELVELADEAPTLHVYLVDEASECAHDRWLDPGHSEWMEAVET
jgi:hypothetical protein